MMKFMWLCDDCKKGVRFQINDPMEFAVILSELKEKEGIRQIIEDGKPVDVCKSCNTIREFLADEDSIDLLEDDESVLSDLEEFKKNLDDSTVR